jgi:hypothetical protein
MPGCVLLPAAGEGWRLWPVSTSNLRLKNRARGECLAIIDKHKLRHLLD